MLRNTKTSYCSIAKFFHWLIFLLVLCMIIYGYLMDDIPKAYKPMAVNIHKLTGLTILALMILRMLWALMNPKPVLPPETKNWERFTERFVHLLLYAVLIAMPLAGWIGATAVGKPPHLGSINFY